MAQSVVKKATFPIGPLRAVIVEVTHTGVTSSTITTDDHGLSNIVFVSGNNETSDTDILIQKNKESGGTVLGSVYTTLVTSNDVVTYLLIGN
jgi:hypothetical protein